MNSSSFGFLETNFEARHKIKCPASTQKLYKKTKESKDQMEKKECFLKKLQL